MFHFIASIFSGIAYAGAVLLWNLGLAGAPVVPPEKPATAALVEQVPAGNAVSDIDLVKQEVESLKKELADIKAQKSAAPAPTPKPKPAPAPAPKPVPVPVPAPVAVPASVPAPAPIPAPASPVLAPGTFMTPSGAIVDAAGHLISGPPGTTVASSTPTPTPTPASAWPPATGTTVNVARYIAVAVEFNPNSPCDQLGFFGAELRLCQLYKNSKTDYTWVLTD